MKVVLLLISLIKISSGFEFNVGACPKCEHLTALDLDVNLTGQWYGN